LFERLEAFGHAVQAEVMQQIEGRMGQQAPVAMPVLPTTSARSPAVAKFMT
jgi:hypothetical protein